MKIEIPKGKDSALDMEAVECCYITIGNYLYYFDDSIEGEVVVNRWRTDKQIPTVDQLGKQLFIGCEVSSCQ